MPGWACWPRTASSTSSCAGRAWSPIPAPSSAPNGRSISASSTPTCPSWCCRSTPRWRSSTASLLEAASDLGARPLAAFLTVTLPLSLPGIVAGCLLVFIPAVGEFVIPDLLGGTDTLMIGKVLWDEFFTNSDWPLASAVAICLLVLLVGPIAAVPAPAGQEPGAAADDRPRALRLHRAGLRLRLPLPADRAGHRLLVQRIAAGHGVGRLLDQMVERAVRQRGDARRRLAVAAHRRW